MPDKRQYAPRNCGYVNTPETVRALLHYSPETGVFTWRERGEQWFTGKRSWYWKIWNSGHAGKRAGLVWTNPRTGYQSRQIKLLGRDHKEHHLAWLYMTDEPLPLQIDHENRDATDNRWCNLRASDNTKNSRNRSMSRANTSGVTGVGWHKRAGKWEARCKIHGKQRHLGYFDDLDEAAMAVMEFRAEHGFDPGHGMAVAHYHQRVAR